MNPRSAETVVLDAERIGALYDAQAGRLIRFFTRRVFDPELAMDLTAETFATAIVKRKTFKGTTPAELEGWMFKIARTQLSRYFRRGRAERRSVERLGLQIPVLAPDEVEAINASIDLEGTRTHLASALAELGEQQREALRLRVIDEMPYDEVADRLGISEQTARARVSRGLRALAKHLDGVIRAQEVLP